jgi:hypothetical protein
MQAIVVLVLTSILALATPGATTVSDEPRPTPLDLSATAQLVTGQVVDGGGRRAFAIELTNTSMTWVGPEINSMTLLLNPPASEPVPEAFGNWTVNVGTATGPGVVHYHAGDPLGPGETATIRFTALVASVTDVTTGKFRLGVSADGGKTFTTPSGELSYTVNP